MCYVTVSVMIRGTLIHVIWMTICRAMGEATYIGALLKWGQVQHHALRCDFKVGSL